MTNTATIPDEQAKALAAATGTSVTGKNWYRVLANSLEAEGSRRGKVFVTGYDGVPVYVSLVALQ